MLGRQQQWSTGHDFRPVLPDDVHVLGDDARQTLINYLDEGGDFATLPDATRQDRLRGLLALLIASPDYQLA